MSKTSSTETRKGREPSRQNALETKAARGSSAKFACACGDLMRTACEGLPFYKEHEGRRYCVLHYPDKEKANDFALAILQKKEAKNFDFRGVWFPSDVDFNEFTFTSDVTFNSAVFAANAYFMSATFAATADFTLAMFKETTYFNEARFNAADFGAATFNGVDFISTVFSAYAYFMSATFQGDADFTGAVFCAETSFRSSNFKSTALFVQSVFRQGASVYFSLTRFGDGVRLQECNFETEYPFNFEGAIFEKPELVIFQSVALRPRWFINVDPRKANFIDATWGGLTRREIRKEIFKLEEKWKRSLHRLLAIAYRQLAMNAEDNNRYSESAAFRYAAMFTYSLEIRQAFRFPQRARDILKQARKAFMSMDLLHSVYGLASGYGEKVGRAAIVLIGIWLLFAVIYWQGDVTWWQPTTNSSIAQAQPAYAGLAPLADALVYSSEVITLQEPEPQPANRLAKVIVLTETIVGPLQVALLALAIRRKFMR